MPVYEYRCKSCGKTHEIEHGFHDQRPTECPACGGELVRVFHPIGVVFKGSGFHKTDYGGSATRPSGDAKTSDAKTAEAKGSETSSGESAKPATTSTDAKPADTKSSRGSSST